MSPSVLCTPVAEDTFENDLNLSITGVGVQYPPFHNGPEAVEILAKRFLPDSNAMKKSLSINRFTGIERRSAIGTPDHPAVNKEHPPSIKELNELFMEHGVDLSTSACMQAIDDAGLAPREITHMVSTTCTNSANPGFDHFVAKNLGLSSSLEKVLLHGIGCSGGLAAIRTACNIALGARARGRRARVLVCACEISSLLVRSELESIHKNQEVRIGVCLFSDCASACVVSNGIGEDDHMGSVYSILGWKHELLEDTAQDLGFDVDPLGWKVILTPRVPSITSAALRPAFESLKASIPSLHSISPQEFDWALHPGGATILTGAQKTLDLTEEHLRCSYEVYMEHGNSSSATILSVLSNERLRGTTGEGEKAKRQIMAAAFGPGVTVELMSLQRGKRGGRGDLDNKITNETVNGHSNGVNGVHTNGSNGVNTRANGAENRNGTNGVQQSGQNEVTVNGHSIQPERLD